MYINKTHAQNEAMSTTNVVLLSVSSGLSGIGALVIIITYAFYRDIRTASRHIIVCISIADLVTTIANCSGESIQPSHNGKDIPCILQSFVGTTAILSSFLWTMVLAIFLYIALVRENQALAKRLIWPWCYIVCWLIPLVINVVALCLGKLGNNEDIGTSGWCWINLNGNKDTVYVACYDTQSLKLLYCYQIF